MLGCCPFRCRNRFNALALARHHQTQAVIAKRLGPVRMPDHTREPLHIGPKSRFTVIRSWQTHSSLPSLKCESCQIDDSPFRQPRLSDSVRIGSCENLKAARWCDERLLLCSSSPLTASPLIRCAAAVYYSRRPWACEAMYLSWL